MVKGVHKRIIEVKINGSRLFDHACLIFKNGDVASLVSEREMIEEANRIIGAVGAREGKRAKKRKRVVWSIILCFALFLCGAVVGFSAGLQI